MKEKQPKEIIIENDSDDLSSRRSSVTSSECEICEGMPDEALTNKPQNTEHLHVKKRKMRASGSTKKIISKKLTGGDLREVTKRITSINWTE